MSGNESMRCMVDCLNIRRWEAENPEPIRSGPFPVPLTLPENLAEMLKMFPAIQLFKKTFKAYEERGKKELFYSILFEWRELNREAAALTMEEGKINLSTHRLLFRLAYKLYTQKRAIDSYGKAVETLWKYKNIDPEMLVLLHRGLTADLVNKVLPDIEAKEYLLKAEPIFYRTMKIGEYYTVEGSEKVYVTRVVSGIPQFSFRPEVEKQRCFTLRAFQQFLKKVAEHSIDVHNITDEDFKYYMLHKIERRNQVDEVKSVEKTIRKKSLISESSRQKDPRLIACYRDAVEYLWMHKSDNALEVFPELTTDVLNSVISTVEQRIQLLFNELLFNREMQVNSGTLSRKFSKHLFSMFLLKVYKGEVKLR